MNDTNEYDKDDHPFDNSPRFFEKKWGEYKGNDVMLFDISNGKGLHLRLSNYGAMIVAINVPDANGNTSNVALGHNSFKEYLKSDYYFGAIIGRVGNRIANGTFSLDDQTYHLDTNIGSNHLHGGQSGFDKKLWDYKIFNTKEGLSKIVFTYTSRDGEEGYPGNLTCKVTYELSKDYNSFSIIYEAKTDKATPINLTNHVYLNLDLGNSKDILKHELQINALKYVPTDQNSIPKGNLESVEGTPFDFTSFKPIGKDINAAHEQIEYGAGYDHTFVINKGERALNYAALVQERKSGRILKVLTTEPGFQLYTGNWIEDIKGSNQINYGKRSGFCIETQHFPDSINQPSFPNTVLRPGEIFESKTVFEFGLMEL